MENQHKYAVTGALAGLANGLFGSGGGLFLVPLFSRWAGLSQRRALATSVAVIFVLSVISAAVYFFKGSLELTGIGPYLIGGALGGFISGRVFGKIPVKVLRKAFGVLLLYGGVRAVLNL